MTIPLSPARRAPRLRKSIFCFAGSVAGLLLTHYAFYPGKLSTDGWYQLQEARTALYTDWHPPLLSWIWRYVEILHRGPALLFLLHAAMFWTGLGIIANLAYTRRRSCLWFLILAGLNPAVFSQQSLMIKDTAMASALTLAFALLLYAEKKSSWRAWSLALPPLTYAIGVRHNGALAAVPFLLWAGLIFPRASGIPLGRNPRRVGWLLGLFLFGSLTAGMKWTNNRLARGTNYYLYQNILLWDLTAISVQTGRLRMPEYILNGRPDLDLALLRHQYTPKALDPLFFNWPPWFDDPHLAAATPALFMTIDKAQIKQLFRYWTQEVRRQPLAYLKHRSRVFMQLLNLNHDPVAQPLCDDDCSAMQNAKVLVDFDTSAPSATLSNAANKTVEWSARTWLFRGYPYLLIPLGLLALALCRRIRLDASQIVLASSSLLYLCSYFFLSMAYYHRYLYWPIIAGTLAVAAALNREKTPGHPEHARQSA